MARTTRVRSQRRIFEATVVASVLGAAPSLLYSLRPDGVLGSLQYGLGATRAVSTLTRRGRPGLIVGAATHLGISFAFGQMLGRLLPRRYSTLWGAACGGAMGVVGAGLIGRRFDAVRELRFGPQLADNIAFGLFFVLVADRRGNHVAQDPSHTRGAGWLRPPVPDLRRGVL